MKQTLHIVLVSIDFLVPHSQSLKMKRREVKSLKERLRSRLNASVAEIDYLDQWQRSLIAVAMISNDKNKLERDISIVNQLLENATDISINKLDVEWL